MADLTGLGSISTATAIETRKGVKLADVARAWDEYYRLHADEASLTHAPELCRVFSDSNSEQVMAEKIALYIDSGTKEVRLCDNSNAMTFHVSSMEAAAASRLFPAFPLKL